LVILGTRYRNLDDGVARAVKDACMRERVNRPTRSRSRDQKQFLNESDHLEIRFDTQVLDRN
jgi:hypothetical protein